MNVDDITLSTYCCLCVNPPSNTFWNACAFFISKPAIRIHKHPGTKKCVPSSDAYFPDHKTTQTPVVAWAWRFQSTILAIGWSWITCSFVILFVVLNRNRYSSRRTVDRPTSWIWLQFTVSLLKWILMCVIWWPFELMLLNFLLIFLFELLWLIL